MMTVLKVIIAVFVLMCLWGLIQGKGRIRASDRQQEKEKRILKSYEEKISGYETNPEVSGVTEDEYILSCYFAEKPYRGYDLKKAAAFHTACQLRRISGQEPMKRLMDESEVYGDAAGEDFDINEFEKLGEQVLGLAEEMRRRENV